jgi:hypothetical protein
MHLLAKDGASVGIGMGQVNRVDSCRLAVDRAGERAAGSVAASDAFFPFEDGPQILIDAGVTALVQPGGSVRDELTIQAAQEAGVFSPYVDAMFACMWERSLKMDDPAVFRQALAEAGLPADRLLELITTDVVKARLMANTEAAVAAGVFGSPSFLVGGELYFGKDRLRDVEEEWLRQVRAPASSKS